MNSTTFPVVGGASFNTTFPHGLPTPPLVRGVLLCTAPDAGSGAIVGDEIPIESVWDLDEFWYCFQVGAGLTTIVVKFYGSTDGKSLTNWRTSYNSPVSSFGNFLLKVYWQ
jgi:hypothetical protein